MVVPLKAYLGADGEVFFSSAVLEGLPQPEPDPTPPPSPYELGYRGLPTPTDLVRHLGWPPLDIEQELAAQQHLERATLLARSYTRGRGFIDGAIIETLKAVVISAAGRSLNNPTSDARVTAGQYSATPGQPDWTLQERLVLDGYRRRVA